MSASRWFWSVVGLCLVVLAGERCSLGADAALPAGVKAVWDMSRAWHQTTPTRETFCINGLWRWQPAQAVDDKVPADNWGFARVPGPMPGGRSSVQIYYPSPSWQGKEAGTKLAWFQREINVPETWTGRRIVVTTAYLNRKATMFVDGKKGSVIDGRGGEADITSLVRPGKTQVLSVLIETTGGGRCGLLGDVYLESTPRTERIDDVKIDPSVREWKLTLNSALTLQAGRKYVLRAEVLDGEQKVKELKSEPFSASDLKTGRFTFSNPWNRPDKLWDINTPGNMYDLKLFLEDTKGKVLDEMTPIRFGFRELWIDGRDFYLNGTRIYCFVIPLDNGGQDIAAASYDGACSTFRRMKAMGVNLMYTHNYRAAVGSHLAFTDIMRAADDTGMLLAISQPHFWDYKWDAPDADSTNGYAPDAEFYVRQVQNHPSVVLYATSHNGCGFDGQQDPDHIDGKYSPWPDPDGKLARVDRAGRLAARAQALIERCDLTRPVYHHDSGNLGRFYTSNCYLDFVPVQERSDWFGHWSAEGVKPLLLIEYGVPLEENWIDWREGHDVMGKALLNQFLFAEWSAQWRGDKAYQISDAEKDNLRYEAKAWRTKTLFHKSQMPHFERNSIPNVREVQAMYIADNWPAFRTWGVTGINAWAQQRFWETDPNSPSQTVAVNTDWDAVQKPGYSPDSFTKPAGLIPNAAGAALVRYSTPVLAYIAGPPENFTSKDHNFLPGQAVAKQIIVINNSRQSVDCECSWSLGLPVPVNGTKSVTVPTGNHLGIPVALALPDDLKPGRYELKLAAKFSSGETQSDSFTIDVLPGPVQPDLKAKVALFDPPGLTAKLLTQLGIPFTPVNADADLAGYDLLIIGKHAITLANPIPRLSGVAAGLKVVIFEQTTEVLQDRLGLRTQEYVLRQVFERVSHDSPVLAGLTPDNLANWRGQGTTVPPRLDVPMTNPNRYPEVNWCGLTETRAWRCGCQGSVASVLIEKPTAGDFLPLIDGGFSLQYAPLMQYREGSGMVLFCQLDVTGRTADDPAAIRLAGNLISYASSWKPAPARKLLYVGGDDLKKQLTAAGFSPTEYVGGELSVDQLLVAAPGAAKTLAPQAKPLAAWLKAGGSLLAVGLDADEAGSFLPYKLVPSKAEYINGEVPPQTIDSPFFGVSPADVYDRDDREIPLITTGANTLAEGVLAKVPDANVVFCQLAPWTFDYKDNFNLKITCRRTSFLLNRIIANMGASATSPILANLQNPLPAHAMLEDVPDVVWLQAGDRELILPKLWKGLPLGKSDAPKGWETLDFKDSRWRDMKVPGYWEEQYPDLINYDGLFLYRVVFDVPADLADQDVTLVLGAVDDEDSTYVNGQFLGSITKENTPTNWYSAVRSYKLSKGLLKPGRNVLAVKVNDLGGNGGLCASLLKRRGVGSDRWLSGLYLDKPEMLDDVYRYYCW